MVTLKYSLFALSHMMLPGTVAPTHRAEMVGAATLPGLHLARCYRRRCTPAVWAAAVCAGWLLLYALHQGSYYLTAPSQAHQLYTRLAVGWYAALLLAGYWAWQRWQQYRPRRQPTA
jgi:glucose-6-phosphate-specific signal transduction histidine kinase